MLITLWEITLGSWLTAGIIILIRLIFCRAISPRAKYLLWMLLVLRLCLPALPESSFSLQNLFVLAESDVSAVEAVETVEKADVVPANIDNTSEHSVSLPEIVSTDGETAMVSEIYSDDYIIEKKITQNDFSPLILIWLVGMIICLVVYGELSVETRRRLRNAVYVDDPDALRCFISVKKELGIKREIRLCYGQECLVGGLRKPTLLIPRELSGQRLEAALTHELLHYKSGDLWIAAFQRLLCCVYWFNPVVWLCFHWARLDCEKACDQRVLELHRVSPAVYAELLFEEAKIKQNFQMGTTSFGRQNIKSRIKFVANFKKPAIWMTILALVLVCVVTVGTLTEKHSHKPWDVFAEIRLGDVLDAYVVSGETKLPLEDHEISEIVSILHEIDDEIFMEAEYCPGGDASLVLECENAIYQIDLVHDPQGEMAIKLDGILWLFNSGELAWAIERQIFEYDLSPATLPLSVLLDISEDCQLMNGLSRYYEEGNEDALRLILDEQLGDYLTDEFVDKFINAEGIGKLWYYTYLHGLTVFCDEIKVTVSDVSELQYTYSASLTVSSDEKTIGDIDVRGVVFCDENFHVTDIYCYSGELNTFYQSLSDQPIYTEFLVFDPVKPDQAEIVDVYIPNTGWSTVLEFGENVDVDAISFSCDDSNIVSFTSERGLLRAEGPGECDAELSYQELVMKLRIHVYNWMTEDIPEVSTLPQEEWKPNLQEIKETLYSDFHLGGDFYQAENCTLKEFLSAVPNADSLTLSTGEVIWRVPRDKCASTANEIGVGFEILTDNEAEYGYFYLKDDAVLENLAEQLALLVQQKEGNVLAKLELVSKYPDGTIWATVFFENDDSGNEGLYLFELSDSDFSVLSMVKK